MLFGFNLPTYWSDYGAGTLPDTVAAAATTAEGLGYDSVWTNDHILVPAGEGRSGNLIEPLITLASLIHLVPRLKLGTSVLVLPQRDAILVAKQVAALDVLSGGRFILGLGVGWNEAEFNFVGADFARRGAVTDEAVAVMRALWRQPEVSYQGQFYNFSGALFDPKPAGDGPPLWVGGNSAPAIRRAARYGDAWVPFNIKLDDFKAGVAGLRAQTEGRSKPTIAAHLTISLRSSGQAHLVGGPAEITAALKQYQAAGLEYLICIFETRDLDDLRRQMHTFAEEIIPQLQ